MANIEHSVITDPDIHEPKDISIATSGSAYIADGAGSGAWSSLVPQNQVLVNELADFPTPSGGVITLADNTEYYIGANNVSIGSNRLVWGDNSVLNGAGSASKLTSTTTGNLFTAADNGLMIVKNLVIDAGSATLFSVTDTVQGSTTVIMDTVQVIDVASLGTISNVLGINLTNNSVINTDQGYSLSSTNTVVTIRQNLIVSTNTSFKAIDFGTSVSSTLEIVDLTVNAPSGAIGLAGSANNANVSSGSIALVSSCEFLGGVTPLDGNLTVDDIRWKYSGNSGIPDTRPDGLLSLTSNATVTALTVSTPALVAGTWVVEDTSHFTGTTGGRLTYNGEKDLIASITANLTVDPASGTNKSIRAYVAINGTVKTNSGQAVNITAADPKQIVLIWQNNFSENDYVEIFIENETDSIDATVIDATLRVE